MLLRRLFDDTLEGLKTFSRMERRQRWQGFKSDWVQMVKLVKTAQMSVITVFAQMIVDL